MFFNLNVHKTLWTKWHFAYYLIKYSYKPLVLTLLQIRAADNGSIGDRKRKMIENVLHLLNVIQITLDPLLMLSYYWRGPTTTLRGTKKNRLPLRVTTIQVSVFCGLLQQRIV